MNFLDFEKIHKVTKYLNWEWAPEDGVSEIYELRQFLRTMINDLIDENLKEIQYGGFRVRKCRESIIVAFEVKYLEV